MAKIDQSFELSDRLSVPGLPMSEDALNSLASDLVAVANGIKCERGIELASLCDEAADAAKDAASAVYEMTTAFSALFEALASVESKPWTVRVGGASGRDAFDINEMCESPAECLELILDGVSPSEAAKYLRSVYGGEALWAFNAVDGSSEAIFDGQEITARSWS